jgi:hypothetical protein
MRIDKKQLSHFLLKGPVAVFIEIFVYWLAFSFDAHYTILGLQTIWSIAISMIIWG